MWISYLCFFFKQKTAYEMRISDWSSDVCSSDLLLANTIKNASAKGTNSGFTSAIKSIGAGAGGFLLEGGFGGFSGGGNEKISKIPNPANDEIIVTATRAIPRTHRKSDEQGKRVSVRVELVVSRIIKNNNKYLL